MLRLFHADEKMLVLKKSDMNQAMLTLADKIDEFINSAIFCSDKNLANELRDYAKPSETTQEEFVTKGYPKLEFVFHNNAILTTLCCAMKLAEYSSDKEMIRLSKQLARLFGYHSKNIHINDQELTQIYADFKQELKSHFAPIYLYK